MFLTFRPKPRNTHEPGARVHYLAQNPDIWTRRGIWPGGFAKGRLICNFRPPVPERSEQAGFRKTSPPLPVVLLDGEDDRKFRVDLFRSIGAALYFKREFPLGGKWGGNSRPQSVGRSIDRSLFSRLHPLPFSVTAASLIPLPDLHRDIDISFVGRASHRKRVKAVRLLREATDFGLQEGSIRSHWTGLRRSRNPGGVWWRRSWLETRLPMDWLKRCGPMNIAHCFTGQKWPCRYGAAGSTPFDIGKLWPRRLC